MKDILGALFTFEAENCVFCTDVGKVYLRSENNKRKIIASIFQYIA